MKLRQDLQVRLDGVQGRLSISAEDQGENGTLVWVSIDDSETSPSIGVDPEDLRAALNFVLGELA